MRNMKVVMILMSFLACGGSSSSSGGKSIGQGPCSGPSDCSTQACVEVNQESYCTQECGSCPSGMYCDSSLFGAIGLKVCLKGSVSQPVEVKEEPPSLSCKEDKDCPKGLVCAQYKKEKSCTKPCKSNDECKPPFDTCPYKIDMLTCSKDESQDRQVCLPKEECMKSLQTCIEFVPDCNMPTPDTEKPDVIENDTVSQEVGKETSGPPGCKVDTCDGVCCPYLPCMDQCQMKCYTEICQDPMNFQECISCLSKCYDTCNVSNDCKGCLDVLDTCAEKNDCDFGPPSENECIGQHCCLEYKACF